jgi:hypothetical protein
MSCLDIQVRGVYSQQLLQRLALAGKNTNEATNVLHSIPESEGSSRCEHETETKMRYK